MSFGNTFGGGQSSIFGTSGSKQQAGGEIPASVPNLNPSRPAEKTEQEFEEELQLALALSESEAEAKKKQQQSLKQQQYKANSSSSSSNLNITGGKSAKSSSEAPPSAPYAESSAPTSVSSSGSKKNKSQVKMPVMERQPDIAIEQFEVYYFKNLEI